MASRLAGTVLGVGFASMVAATAVALNAGQTLGGAAVSTTLDSLRASGSFDVVAQLAYYERVATQLAASPQAAAAIQEFSAGIDELSTLSESDVREQFDELLEEYGERYLDPLRKAGLAAPIREVVSERPAAVYLQASYVLDEGPINDPLLIDDPGDGSTWTSVHARVHPVYRTAVREAGLLDIYLIDAASERIVYSASKGPDLGTSLSVGPYSGSVVGRAADAASTSDGAISTDLSYYNGVPGVAVGAVAAPVLSDGNPVGVIVLTYDGAVFTEQLTSVVNATEDQEATVDDLYLVGGDGTTRSDPQSYLTDPSGFLDASVAAGVLRPESRSTIEAIGTTVLLQPASDSATSAASDGDTDADFRTSMTGSSVVSVVQRLPLDDVEWIMVAELDVMSARSAVAAFREILLVGASVFVVTLAFVAVAWANRIMHPVRVISDRLGRAAQAGFGAPELEPVTIRDTSPVELHRLADSFSSMGTALYRQESELSDARAQRLSVMTQMLPPSLAQRISRGDVESLDEVPNASVVVLVVLGLGELVRGDSGGQGRELLDDLTGELDDIARQNGLDRIKVVGDSYFAACGHDRPYIDHATRAIAFAQQVATAVDAASAASPTQLTTTIAVNSGPVTVGMSGGARLVYDVWGPTVTVAHDLARSARAGETVVTEATRARLPDEIELVPWRSDATREEGPPLWTLASESNVGATAGSEARP